jgi:hypothetical protein
LRFVPKCCRLELKQGRTPKGNRQRHLPSNLVIEAFTSAQGMASSGFFS